MNYVRRGTGSPLVLVHGLGSRWQCWSPVIDTLAEHHDVVAVDLPGFGDTPRDPAYDESPPGYAAWVADQLSAQGIVRPHVVGNSMGGGIALELGRAGVASRVTAFSPIGFWSTPGRMWCQGVLTSLRGTGKALSPLVEPLAALPPMRAALLGAVVARPSQVSTEDAVVQARGLIDSSGFPGARDSFSSYSFGPGSDPGRLRDIPVTIAWGTRDVLLTHRTQSRRARRLFPGFRHVDLPGLGHVPFSDDPALCARVILEEQP